MPLTVQGIKIEAVPAYNIVQKRPDGQPFHPKGSGNGYIINFDKTRVYVAGDTENIPEMKQLKNIDVAFLPMNLPYTMTPEMVAEAAKAFGPKILYPYHYGQTDPNKLVDLLKDSKIASPCPQDEVKSIMGSMEEPSVRRRQPFLRKGILIAMGVAVGVARGLLCRRGAFCLRRKGRLFKDPLRSFLTGVGVAGVAYPLCAWGPGDAAEIRRLSPYFEGAFIAGAIESGRLYLCRCRSGVRRLRRLRSGPVVG